MLFDRYSSSSPRGTPRSPAMLRAMIAGALSAFVAGALLRALEPGGMVGFVAGSSLVVLSIALAGLVTSSSIARLAGDHEEELDEYERSLSLRALSLAYRQLGALILALAIYAMLAPDLGWWLPSTDQWAGVLFFLFLCFLVLPTSILLRRLPGEELEPAKTDEETA